MNFLKRFSTRWDRIPSPGHGYRLLCSHLTCSLSCLNLKNGRLSVTSVHGTDRHSQELSKNDMVFATIIFLNSLTDKELEIFGTLFNKMNPNKVLTVETIDYNES